MVHDGDADAMQAALMSIVVETMVLACLSTILGVGGGGRLGWRGALVNAYNQL